MTDEELPKPTGAPLPPTKGAARGAGTPGNAVPPPPPPTESGQLDLTGTLPTVAPTEPTSLFPPVSTPPTVPPPPQAPPQMPPHPPSAPSPTRGDPGWNAAPPPPQRSRGALMALVVVMALVIGGLVVALVLKRTGEHVSPTTTVQPGGESSTTASTSTSVSSSTTSTTEPTTTTTTTTVVPVDPEGAAFAAIDQFATGDRAQVESLSGSWVPQVSTKAAGLEVNGVVFDWRMTLSDHEQLRSRYDAIVLRSGDFNYAKAGFYVTVVPTAYSTPEEANGWCDSQGIGADDCFAKRIRVGPYSTADVVYRK